MTIPDAALQAWMPESRAEAEALIEAVRARAACCKPPVELGEAPEAPNSCCGRGCNGCVWEGYFSAVTYWRDEAMLRIGA
jgi:hypothetical protein